MCQGTPFRPMSLVKDRTKDQNLVGRKNIEKEGYCKEVRSFV
jgi:hypothetical protein